MSLAAEAREAVREHPFLLSALRAGVVNHRAAAEFLELDGDPDAVATALRRFAETLPEYETESRDARVTMHSGVGVVGGRTDPGDGDGGTDPGDVDGGTDPGNVDGDTDIGDVDGGTDTDGDVGAVEETESLLLIGDSAVVPDAGDLTAVVATGDVDAVAASAVLDRLGVDDVDVIAAGVDESTLVVVVPRRAGATTVRLVENTLAAIPA